MSCFDEIIRQDNVDLLECVWEQAKAMKRDYKTVNNKYFI